MPRSSAPQPIARPCAAAIATRIPVKLPGPTPTRIRSRAAAVEQLGDHRHQPLGMAAADQLVALREARAVAVEQSGGAGGARRVERQDHGANSGHMRLNAASPRKLDGFDGFTSGT